MKRRLLQLLLMLGMVQGFCVQASADEVACLTVTQNGENAVYELDNIQKITFDAENMFLTMTAGDVVTCPLSLVSMLTFSVPTGIETVSRQQSGLSMKEGVLHVDMQDAGTVVLYDTNGKLLKRIPVSAGQNTIPLGQWPKGVYLIKVNGNVSKMMNN